MLQVLKAKSSSREKKMEKRRGAKTHPCFVPEVTLKAADMSPPSITWASIPSWKERLMFTNLVHTYMHTQTDKQADRQTDRQTVWCTVT